MIHQWKWDWPWHMVKLRDWFYMVDHSHVFAGGWHFHVRILGLRSYWFIPANSPRGPEYADPHDDPAYQEYVEAAAESCRCDYDRPCEGVLCGGLCDERRHMRSKPNFAGSKRPATRCPKC